MKTNTIKLICAALILTLSSLACGLGSSAAPATATVVVLPTSAPLPTTAPNEDVNQWAVAASASSEFGVSGWIASQATGAPDVTECGDNAAAWASSSTDAVEWLQLDYATPVYASEVVIYNTYNPSYVIYVDLIEPNGGTHTVWSGVPESMDCPAKLMVSFEKTDYLVNGVVVTIDQSTLNSWSEIDAVQLIGTLK